MKSLLLANNIFSLPASSEMNLYLSTGCTAEQILKTKIMPRRHRLVKISKFTIKQTTGSACRKRKMETNRRQSLHTRVQGFNNLVLPGP
jgi:hypothetical protein